MKRKIKVLVITHSSWRNDTSVGNSYSNIFVGMDDRIEFAQIYIRDGIPENNLVHKYFKISEKKLLKSVFTRKPVGKKYILDNPMNTHFVNFSKKYNIMRSLRWNIFLLGRDIASSLGKWKTKELDLFLEEFKPDIIFGTLTFIPVINQLMIYSKKKTGAKLVTYPWDDWYHINSNSWSLFYYIRIYLERYYIRKCVKSCKFLYTITEQMKNEYTRIFNKKCKILRKGYDFKNKHIIKKLNLDEISLVYVGNIGDKRWEVLAYIAKVIKEFNVNNEIKFCQYIYTLSPVNNKVKTSLNIPGASKMMGSIPSNKVSGVMDKADILIHVEPVDKIRLETCRLSFSTKLVDYFFNGKCILAVGGQNASMNYLKANDAALIVDDLEMLYEVIKNIATNPTIIYDYGNKAWECGKKNHDINVIQKMIYQDFLNLINDEEYQHDC